MAHQSNQREPNIEGLRSNAQKKAENTRLRAEQALTLLIKEQRPINFKTVAETAGISTAWLYANQDIKQRIAHLRSQQVPKAQMKIPAREQASNASKDALIAALQKRVRVQAERIKELEQQLEVAYGHFYTRKGAEP
jgi:glucan phosphoethanolaminetransferase (alkaline phosphatase superfamily)